MSRILSQKSPTKLAQSRSFSFTTTAQGIRNYPHRTRTLNDGYQIPIFGFGTWGCDAFNADIMAQSTSHAINSGYRLFDCARVYKNEKELGHVFTDAYKAGTVEREELYIVSKLYNNEHAPPKSAPISACESTLRDLQSDYLDMLMIHWPVPNIPSDPNPQPYNLDGVFATWIAMNDLVDNGLVRSLGMSNWSIGKMDALVGACLEYNADAKENGRSPVRIPAYHQIELHPYLQSPAKLEQCTRYGIIPSASMPLGSPERPPRWIRDDDPVILENPVVARIADEMGVSPAQAILAWHMQRGCVTTPKATVDWMIEENWKAQVMTLSDEQMDAMAGVDQNVRFMRGEVFLWEDGQDWKDLWDGEY